LESKVFTRINNTDLMIGPIHYCIIGGRVSVVSSRGVIIALRTVTVVA
jgi:hypothetical protein